MQVNAHVGFLKNVKLGELGMVLAVGGQFTQSLVGLYTNSTHSPVSICGLGEPGFH